MASSKKRKPRPAPSRYGIAEWFGREILTLTPAERQQAAKLAQQQCQEGDLSNAPPCPFLSTLIPSARCNKASGVCSIRKYEKGENDIGVPVPGDKIVTICPLRFLQTLGENKSLFEWVSENMLDISNATVVKETPFLRKIGGPIQEILEADQDEIDDEVDAEEEGKKAGRIDWILVDPATMDSSELRWCAVETQALYFSGDKMPPEFAPYAAAPSPVLFPTGKRRPDYRSSGPKRLSPQLDVKVPVLRNWGKKVVIVIDRYFYENMNELEDAFPRARNDRDRRDMADVVWFVVDYSPQSGLTPYKIIYTTLESSRRALNATEPLSKEKFTEDLKKVIRSNSRTNKVFKSSK
jgi:hypothetical protein